MLLHCSPGLAKKHVFGSSGGCRGGGLPNSCLRVGYHGIVHEILNLTARWYGELPSVSGLACVFAKSR